MLGWSVDEEDKWFERLYGDLLSENPSFHFWENSERWTIDICSMWMDSFGVYFSEVALPGSFPGLRGKGHGEVFHIVMTAYYQAMSYVPGQRLLKGIEKVRSVWLFAQDVTDFDDAIESGKTLACFVRRADIVLGNPAEPISNELWVELKSYRAKDNQKYTPTAGLPDVWRMQKNSRDKKSALHRQFVLDRVAVEGAAEGAIATRGDWPKGAAPNNLGRRVKVDEFKWWFQSFNRLVAGKREIAVDIGSVSSKSSILGVFSRSPEGETAVVSYNLGVDSKASYPLAASKAGMAKAKTLLIDAIRKTGRPDWLDMFDQILEEAGIEE